MEWRHGYGGGVSKCLSGAIVFSGLLLEERFQQAGQAATIFRIHSREFDSHSAAGSDAAHHSASLDFAGARRQRYDHFYESFGWRRIRRADKQAAEGDVFEAGNEALRAALPAHKHSVGRFYARVTPRWSCSRHPKPTSGADTNTRGVSRGFVFIPSLKRV